MPMPPKDIEPNDLFLRMVSAEDPTELVDNPHPDIDEKLRIRGLDHDDLEPLLIKARKKLVEKHKLTSADLETKFWDLRLQDATAKEVLPAVVLRENPIPGSEATEQGIQYPRVFLNAEAVGKLRPREIGILWAMWTLVQNRISPTESMLSEPEQVRAWVKVLKEGARPFGFFQLELPQQEVLLTSLLQWAECLLELLSSLPESLPSNWESILDSYGFDTTWCSALAANSTPSTTSSSDDAVGEPMEEAFSDEEAELRAREMLNMARKVSDDNRE